MHAPQYNKPARAEQQNNTLKQGIFFRFVRLDSRDIQPFQQPTQFTCRELHGSGITTTWPPESLFLKAPIEEPESIIMPVKDFDLVAQSIAENKQMTGKRIGFQNILHHHHETVDGFPHIGRTACQIHLGV
jgi:hypothetical protein